MLYTILLTLLLIYSLDRLHSSRVENQVLRFQYRLYEIRDHLREAAMKGEVDCQNWVFQYLDSSIAKTIDILPQVSLWQGLALWYTYRNDPKTQAAVEHLDKALKKPENKFLGKIYHLYAGILILYLWERHFVYSFTLVKLAKAVTSLQKAGQSQVHSPGTSTLVDYA